MLPWHYWIIAGIVLCILEMFTADFVLLGLGFAAVGAGIAASADASLSWQLATFAIVAVVFIFGVRPVAKRNLYKHSDPRPSNVGAMIGKSAVVVDAIAGNHAVGRVRLGSEEWRAVSASGSGELASGTTVRIHAIDGATLVVSGDSHTPDSD